MALSPDVEREAARIRAGWTPEEEFRRRAHPDDRQPARVQTGKLRMKPDRTGPGRTSENSRDNSSHGNAGD